jgi:hypothetical protein
MGPEVNDQVSLQWPLISITVELKPENTEKINL